MDCQTSLRQLIAQRQAPYRAKYEKIKQSMERTTPSGTALMNVGLLVWRAAQKFPNRCALRYQGSTMTYAQLFASASLLSLKLREAGLSKGHTVLILMPNACEFYVAYFAVLQLGAVAVPLNTFLHERELQHIVHDAQAQALIAHTSFNELLTKAQLSVPRVFSEQDMQVYRDAQSAPQVAFQPEAVAPQELAVLLYTSGTTGLPKGVMLSSTNIMTNIAQSLCSFPVTEHDRVYAVLPLFHSFAQNATVWTPFFVGASVILVPRIERRAIAQALEEKPTVFLGIPALYGLLCLMKTADLESVRYFVCGGDALPNKIRTAFALLYGRKICNGYGMTETSPIIAVHVDDGLSAANVVGTVCPGLEVSVRDEQGAEVPRGQEGVLWVKGDNVMMGYYHAPEATAEILRDGWLCTGDVVQFDAQGLMAICGRQKDLIIHKGFNIYPPEIENIIFNHPAVLRSAVIGKPDADVGEVVLAFVELKDEEKKNAAFIEKELMELCKQQLAAYKVPRQFIVRDRLPVTATGKVSKKELRAQLHDLPTV